MKLSPRRGLVILGLIIIAAILAVPMRGTVYNAVVIPAAYLGWGMHLLYRSVPQVLLWWLVIAAMFFVLLFSMLPNLKFTRKQAVQPKARHGQVEDLAIWLGRTKGGVYFKWLVANRLGKLAYQILVHRENGRPRTVFQPLVGEDWQPSHELREYLETGLHGSFSDFSGPKHPLAVQPKTPLDYDVHDAVEFLETQVENGRDSG
jgi:hypothetical protein